MGINRVHPGVLCTPGGLSASPSPTQCVTLPDMPGDVSSPTGAGRRGSYARDWKVTMVLTLTPDAAHVIQDLVSDHPGAGLRISSNPVDTDRIELGLAVTASPEPSDQIVDEQGSQVFLDLQVAPLLEDRTLDVEVSDDREVAFKLLP